MWTKLTTWLAFSLVCTSVLPGGAVLCFGTDGHCAIESLYAKGCSQSQPAGDLPGIGSTSACYDLSIPDTINGLVVARKTMEISAPSMVYPLPSVSIAFSGYWFNEPVRQWNPGDLHAFRDLVILLN
jgi:hypothetical protein